MSIFANMTTNDLEKSKDTLGGYQPLDSGAYTGKIKGVYITTSKSNAMAANLVLDLDGREYKETLWITNRNGENFYKSKSGHKIGLPGFTILNDLCLVTLNKELRELDTEPRVFKVYDPESKGEVNREFPTIVDLSGKEAIFGIIRQVVNKTVKDASGNYVPSQETKDENVIEKIFHEPTHKTVNEAVAGKEEAEFFDKWLEKNKGVTRDRTKKVEGAAAQAAERKPAKSLFS